MEGNTLLTTCAWACAGSFIPHVHGLHRLPIESCILLKSTTHCPQSNYKSSPQKTFHLLFTSRKYRHRPSNYISASGVVSFGVERFQHLVVIRVKTMCSYNLPALILWLEKSVNKVCWECVI